jgi:murein DD-endopeptidase MepM/ murein hydrolase activator NlpD
MKLLKILSIAVVVMLFSLPVYAERFLTSPLQCGDPSCTFQYSQGVYTPGIMNSILDHSLKQNPNSMWQFGTLNSGGGDGVIVAFNGERVSGTPKSTDVTCIGGRINLRPTSSSLPMTNASGCGSGYTSYDEHPGYDYRAALNTKVKAAAPGRVVNIAGVGCINTNLPGGCNAFGYVGIDHGNGYITQYGHLIPTSIKVSAGATVYEGQVIGLAGHTGLTSGDHLHFEVLKKIGTEYLVVDPYGWVGSGSDPLYSASNVPPALLWADRCDRFTAAEPVKSGYGAAYNVFSAYKEVLLRASCSNSKLTFTVGNGSPTQYVYRYGYEWQDGTWSPITFTGANPSGDWFIGQAQVSRSRLSSEIGKESYFVAYTCVKQGDVWKCGCRDSACTTASWQQQSFK